ncbi:T-cell surface antigen CD2 [Oryzias melastigma]|uniref:T-cell surface antigen CD2 n=1 Tax=Oryzias melastigma TaxID=30732 RepID=A0A834EZQ4_ORYME|nr:T-cell surface antigen CD2 [Oryzias melastigma]
MACLAVSIILLGFTAFLDARKDTCDLYGAVGQNLVLPFDYKELKSQNTLKWTHNEKVIFHRKISKVNVGKPEDIDSTGSLSLKNLQFTSAGNYKATVWYSNGTFEKEWDGRLCVMEKVPKPQLTYICDFKSNAVKLNCNVSKPRGLNYSWTVDERILTNEKAQTLSVSFNEAKEERRFSCSVENRVSKESSDRVHLTCKKESPQLLCFPKKIVMAVLAGGAGLIFLLIIVVAALCSCRSKSHMTVEDEGEPEMLSLNKQEPGSPTSCDYEQMHIIENSSVPTPQVSGGSLYANVSKQKAQTENPPQQLSAPAEVGQDASPVPKPRTRMGVKPNI